MAGAAGNRTTKVPQTFIAYEHPSRAAMIGATVFSILLTSLTFNPDLHAAVRRKIPLPSRQLFRRWFVIGGLLHVAEAGYAYRLAARSGRSTVAMRWALSNFFVGFPVLRRLRALVRSGDRSPSAPAIPVYDIAAAAP
jgi:Domain of unknown function (DUF4499)